MIDITKLPLSVTSFSDFIAKSKIYVDKTDLIANLARFDVPIFLSRPRRFGKSTLVSTFHELFSNGLEKFKGLKIDTEGLWNDKTYNVLHLDLSLIKENTQKSFEEALLTQLKIACEATNDNLKQDFCSAATYLQLFLHNTDKQYVLLIDEYDAPLTAVMADKEEFEKRRSVLSEFFLTVKSYSSKFRFIFITGVTRYSNTSIFSAFNNIKDISFNPTYGAIVGYTQEELEYYFKDYIENAAAALNKKEKTEDKYTYESILNELKNNYDGYSFDEECEHHVYNPWSILNFLSDPQYGFKPYWLETGGAKPSLLVNYLNNFVDKKVNKTELVDYLDLEFTKVTTPSDLSPSISSIEDENFPFFAILYQAGYFTIKDTGINYLEVGLPNLEVKKAFAEIILNKLTAKTAAQISACYGKKVRAALDARDFKALKDEFNKILNEFSYESVSAFKEYAFRDVYKVILQLLGYNTYTEYQTALGRSDLCFEDDKRLYVVEFKVVGKADDSKVKLEEAKQQIKNKKYGTRLTAKEVVTLVVVIVNQNRRVRKAETNQYIALLSK